ncbi:hypothetical protein QFC21_006198 [Naganishia friedmannii]|uniref:Uncharacterized protein n=1 Tax=Naganishia friedmannii TaxID=89922 RepID=A0ACC2V689_9TREE|nr:hypothetical protein QFC21_006198 [Naganishia friedmannii]
MRTSAYQDVQGPHSSSSAKTGQKEIPTSTMPRLDRDDAYYTLRTLTIAAIGATYAEDRLKPLGGYLMELARRIGSYLQLGDPRSIFSIPFIQSRLLIAVGGFADGSRERYLMSEISKGLLITAARRLHLLRERPARQRVSRHRTAESHLAKERSLDRQPTSKEIKKMWREWLEEEERIRLGWAIYIFDAQAAAFLNVPAAFNLNEIQIRLPDAEELWNISNATMWEESYRSRKGTIEQSPRSSHFGTILSTMLREGRLQERVSDFGRWILAHGLYRMCDDANMQNKLLGYIEPTFPPLAESFTRPNQKNPFQLIGSLVTSWQSEVSFARPSTFFASSNVLRHYLSIRFIHPTFMDHVKWAAGRLSAAESREESQRWLTETPPDSVLRRIFVESIHLAVFLLHSRLDAPWEPVILLDCALALWAILRFRPEMLQLCATSPGATVLRCESICPSDAPDRAYRQTVPAGFRSTDYLEKWISNGGPLRIQGMSYSMTPDNVLSDFITRLQSSPWGLSNLYAAVLNNLQSKDEVKP